jgi:type II secretory pathway pseudopilin PulG
MTMPPQLQNARPGAVLLEAIIALAILGSLLGAGAWLGAEAVRAVVQTHTAEAAVRDADRLLRHVALWPRRDLDLHLGETPQDPWLLRVHRLEPTLYDIAILEGGTGVVVLATTLFRRVE